MEESKVRSILLIDDDEDEFDLVMEAVQNIDPEVSVSYLDRCENRNKYEGKNFDLVLLDINMPHHDGFSWLRGIRENGYDMPVIMYTNSASPSHIVKAYSEGATLYFTKPESYLQLVQGIKKLLNLNWDDPGAITRMHVQEGQFETFRVA